MAAFLLSVLNCGIWFANIIIPPNFNIEFIVFLILLALEGLETVFMLLQKNENTGGEHKVAN